MSKLKSRTPLTEAESFHFLVECCGDYVLGGDKIKIGPQTDQKISEAVLQTQDQVRRFASAFSILTTAAEDIEKAQRMLRSSPARNTRIATSDHLHLMWFLVQNLCYNFEEKLKLYFNEQQDLAKVLGLPSAEWLKGELREIKVGMGDAISQRGRSVHKWPVFQPQTSLLSMVETINLSSAKSEFDLLEQVTVARGDLIRKSEVYIDTAFAAVRRCFLTHAPTPPAMVKSFNALATSVGLGQDRLGDNK